ncbi:molybdopterin molybdotransferase MoeA [Aeromicrobium sp. Sec7.5]|uniref:molybdopterin molybdotransferase MoeA n=1 Tax=Aeromicrobium sp. Sec7.5 TaxID=3121276 RepID=UPI002FE4539B
MTPGTPDGAGPVTPTSSLVEVDEHQERILRAAARLASEQVDLRSAAGRTLAADVVAARDVPTFDNSGMDGFAVRFADVRDAAPGRPVALDVVADVPAGSSLDPDLLPGQAVRIMTGAAIPTQADTVVPFEDTREGLDAGVERITVLSAPSGHGRHVRGRGEDVATGDLLMHGGTRLGAMQVAAALSAGHVTVEVSRTPRVAILSTGDELVTDGSDLAPGQIPESNGPMLAELARAADATVVELGSTGDDDAALLDLIRELSTRADVIVLTGGVGTGAHDVVKSALGGAGLMDFLRVRMQPGKPQGFGVTASGQLLFGLPGNPVSAAASWEVSVRPALLALQGRSGPAHRTMRLQAATGWPSPPDRRQYVPVVLDTTDPAAWTVRPASAGHSGSHLVGSLAHADAWAVVPADISRVEAGMLVEVMLAP